MSLDVALYDGVLSISDETDTLLYDGVSQVCNLDVCLLFLLCTLPIAHSLNLLLSLSLKYTCEVILCSQPAILLMVQALSSLFLANLFTLANSDHTTC